MRGPQTPALGCPVREDFDPLSAEFLAEPYAVLASLPVQEMPVFYAPSIDYYVVTRYADVESVFLDPGTYSAAAAQLPLVGNLVRRLLEDRWRWERSSPTGRSSRPRSR